MRAAGQQISYDYTFLRLNTITYPQFTENNVAYTYGAPGAAFNRANRIVTVTDESGLTEREYGPLGEVVKETRTINSDTKGNSKNSPEVHTTAFTFDTWNRLQSLIYPDGEVLDFDYDSGGLVEHIDGVKAGNSYAYLNFMGYDKFGQRTRVAYGNATTMDYTYDDEDRRLATLNSDKTGGRNFMSLSYGYDEVGNVLSMANGTPVPTDDLKGGPTSYNYTYDDLYRLTDATGNYKEGAGHTHEYTLAMAYDTIHNITGKTQAHNRITPPPDNSVIPQHKTTYDWSYDYGSSKPHAATHIGDRTFTYDANGNQTGWDNDNNGQRRTIIWDEENRIQSIIDNGKTSTYKYNDQGERAIKRTGQGETVYVNQWYVIRDREVGEKHVFAGTTRISTKLEKPDGPGGGAPLEDAHYFYHPDHLGSSSYITNDLGQVFQHLEYFPFGETFVEEHSNTQRAPYLFTGKELDEDTGLYYYGARYYDPRTSLWQSADPVLAKYLPGAGEEAGPTDDIKITLPSLANNYGSPRHDLPGIGGVFTGQNLNLYAYTPPKSGQI